jgi:uncharacterized protein (TIRG00374 family)
MKKTLYPILRISVSGLLILILLYIMRGKYAEIATVLKNTSVPVIGVGLLSFLAAIAVASFRLKLIIAAQEERLTYAEAVSLTFVGYFFNNFLPTSIGGDIAKMYCLSRRTNGTMPAFAAVAADRLIGLLTMVFMAFVAMFFVEARSLDSSVRILILAITAVSVIGIIFMVNERFARIFSVPLFFLKPMKENLKKAYSAVNKYRHHKALIVQSFLISILSQLLFFASVAVFAMSIGAYLPIVDVLLRMPIIGIVSLFPSINGLGLREGATVVFFAPMIGKEKALAVGILWFFILLVTSLIGGAIYALSPKLWVKFREIEKERETI